MEIFTNPDLYAWVFLPLLTFTARIADVTLGTIRIIFINRGKKVMAPLLGFMEVFIWVSVISQIVRGAHNIVAYLAYAGGFAVGNYVGMLIEDKLAIGTLVVRAIVPKQANELAGKLRADGFGATIVDAHGSHGPVELVYTIVMRKDLLKVAHIIQDTHPGAFFTVEELRSVERGIFPPSYSRRPLGSLPGRKSK